MSNITEDRLAELVLWLDRKWARHKEEEDLEAANALRSYQLLRASAPVLSEEQRAALEAGALALSYLSYGGESFASQKERAMKAQAALLRGMAQSG